MPAERDQTTSTRPPLVTKLNAISGPTPTTGGTHGLRSTRRRSATRPSPRTDRRTSPIDANEIDIEVPELRGQRRDRNRGHRHDRREPAHRRSSSRSSAGESGTVKIPLTTKPTPGHGHDGRGARSTRCPASRSRTTTRPPTRSSSAPAEPRPERGLAVRIAYLGPRGTFNEDALRAAVGDAEVEAAPAASVYDAILAVREGEADRALVPFENSIEGAVSATLDTLAFDADGRHPGRRVRPADPPLPDRPGGDAAGADRGRALAPAAAAPSARASSGRTCRRLRCAPLRAPRRRSGSSPSPTEPWAALGAAVRGRALRRRGPARGRRGRARQHHPLRLGRPGRHRAGRARSRGAPRWSSPSSARTTPGRWWTRSRCSPTASINLTRIESRPLRRGLGRYQFFLDIEGRAGEEPLSRGDRGAARQGRVRTRPRQLADRGRAGRARSRLAGQESAESGAAPLQSRGIWATGPTAEQAASTAMRSRTRNGHDPAHDGPRATAR